MNLSKVDYELSVWQTEDQFRIQFGSNTPIVVNSLIGYESYTILNEYRKEFLCASLANNDFDSPLSAFNINLEKNINGQNKLTFSLPYKYYNIEDGRVDFNPFINYAIVGAHIKLKYDYLRDDSGALILDTNNNKISKWYDFVIIKADESQDDNIISYECDDYHASELSRNGYRVELNTELENNMGSATQLSDYILSDTDWHTVGSDGTTLSTGITIRSDILKATNNEVLYNYTLNNSLSVKVIDNYTYGNESWTKDQTYTIPSGSVVYISSTCYINKQNPVSLLWRSDGQYITDDDGTILNSPNYQGTISTLYSSTAYVDTFYRGNMLESKNVTKYIPALDQLCTQYSRSEYYSVTTDSAPIKGKPYFIKQGDEFVLYTGQFVSGITYYEISYNVPSEIAGTDNVLYYSYDKYEYPSITSLAQLISNNTNFSSTYGWDQSKTSIQYTFNDSTSKFDYWLKIQFVGNDNYCDNYGIDSCKTLMSPNKEPIFTVGETYICAIKAYNTQPQNIDISSVEIYGNNSYSAGTTENILFATSQVISSGITAPELSGYKLFRLTINRNLSYENGVTYWKLFTRLNGTGYTKLLDCRLFKETYVNGNLVVPDLGKTIADTIKTKHYLFRQDYAQYMPWVRTIDDIIFNEVCYDSDLLNRGFSLRINDNYEKVTTITDKESNYYNLIQDICETFECWSKFIVDYSDNGEILYKYKITNDNYPQAGKQYYRLTTQNPPTYFGDNYYQIVDSNLFFSQCSQYEVYNNSNIYYVRVRNGVYSQVDLGYQYYGNETNYYYQQYNLATNTISYVHCQYDTPYDSSKNYYMLIMGDMTKVSVTNVFHDNPTSYYKVNNNWQPANLYEKQYEKYVIYRQYVGRENDAGFKYGINLNTITRSVDGQNVCTKLYVPDQQSDILETGICSIQDSTLNYSGETSIYNFQYYIHNQLLDQKNFMRDLYGDNTGGLAFLTTTAELNRNSRATTEELLQVAAVINQIASKAQTYNTYLTSAEETIKTYTDYIQKWKGNITYAEAYSLVYDTSMPDAVKTYIQKRDQAKDQYDKYQQLASNAQSQYQKYQTQYNNLLNSSYISLDKKLTIMTEFYKKYSQFIKEGVWSSENTYYDPDNYCSDAQRVSNSSAFPQISYDLRAMELSQIEGYESYNFDIGDKTYIEDVDFFGYSSITEQPYKEEVIVSKIVYCLDNPSENTITIQNYKTQFQDMFQRITASTQSYSLNENAYLVAANVVSDTSSTEVLLNQILQTNKLTISNAGAQTVEMNEKGLTITDDTNPIYQLRAIGRGIYLTQDGGNTWYTGISAEGINATMINAGSINTNQVSIQDGYYTSFLWNADGLTAYYKDSVTGGINYNKFIRFDGNGIYGVPDATNLPAHPNITQIQNNSTFSLTWDGFTFKALNSNNWVTISNKYGAETIDNIDVYLYDLVQEGAIIQSDVTYYTYNVSTNLYEVSFPTPGSLAPASTYYTRYSQSIPKNRMISAGTGNAVNFAVYEDGTIKANNGIFTGIVRAIDVVDSNGNSMFFNNRWTSEYCAADARFG